MERLGVGRESVAARNPRLVSCSITGYGQDGPYRDAVGHDINYLGYAGALWLGGPADSDPQLPGVQVGDLGGGGMMAAVGILAALVERDRMGHGRFLDVSMLDGIVSWLSIHLGTHLADPGLLATARPLSGDLACYRIYRAGDGRYLTVGALEPRFWRTLCEELDCPDLVDEQYAPPGRQAEMAVILQDRFATRSRDEWMQRFGSVSACVGPVNDLAEAVADPQIQHRGMIAEVDGRPVGPAAALKLGPSPERPAPGLGEHTDEVLAELGLSVDEVSRLHEQGVV